jgi:energy-coupling factor transport system ATP-binding protein
VRDVDLVVEAGERVALVGPNGSGKSTLGRLLVGLLRASHGTIRLAGRDPSRLSPRELAREAGYIFQDPDLGFIADRVIDEVTAGLPRNRLADAEEVLERLGLPPADFAGRSPYRLSGGEARRLSLAAALVRNPALLVLDEPTYGQDRRGYEALLEILRERISAGAAVIAATHDERLVADFAGRRVEMADGWIVADEPVVAGEVADREAQGHLAEGRAS